MLEVIVPATSANIGPGFDSLGIALSLYNKFYFSEITEGLEITGCDTMYSNENNLIYTSMLYFYKKIDPQKKLNGIKIHIESNIPVSRGLGSSATCIIAGVVAANILSESYLSKDDLLDIATEIEGHPDNIAPALFGNMTVSIIENKKVYYNIINIPKELTFCAIVPSFELSTTKSRMVLPKELPLKSCVYNIGRVSLLISSFYNKNYNLIKLSCQDKIHQDLRGELIPNYFDIVDTSYSYGSLGVFLSGAGPTIMSINKDATKSFKDNLSLFLNTLNNKWTIMELCCDTNGTIVNIIN